MKKICTLFMLLFTVLIHAQGVKPYEIYNSKGKKISFEKMIKDLQNTDLVLFGEFHDNSIVHWLQLKTVKALAQKKPLIIGMEMLESDNQSAIDAYVNGSITQKQLDSTARLWNNYKTDYKPIVDFSKENNIKVVASNVPRRYASLLYKEGVEALQNLPATEQQWIAPLPFPYDPTLPAYVKMMEMFKDSDHANDNFPKAQAIKDATMAHFISSNFEKGKTFIHFNGSYHSNNYEGIFWYINNYNPKMQVKTISVLEKENINEISATERQLADFIIIVDKDMIKTF